MPKSTDLLARYRGAAATEFNRIELRYFVCFRCRARERRSRRERNPLGYVRDAELFKDHASARLL
jgi:hypothetical protein